jgi:flagellar protein FliJ
MSWKASLIRISTYEVELLQKRLAEIVARRWQVEMRIAALDAEVEAEAALDPVVAEACIYLIGFREGVRIRRAGLEAELSSVEAEEAGARDALSEAFEGLKKFEHVAETERVAAVKEAGRRESAELDEVGLRRAAR